jgi:glutamate-1-semialdehyde 2,1-aminomutase
LNDTRLTNVTLDDVLEVARAAFVARNPSSRTQHARAAESLPGGNTRSVLFYEPFPLTIARGAGCRLWDIDGHEYIDFLGEYTAGLYGHSHPAIRAAITAALDNGLSLAGHTRAEVDLAEAIRARFPSMQTLRFTNSGTEANLLALAAATAFTKRRRIMVFHGGYHGGVMTFAKPTSPVNVPHDFVLAPYNDIAATEALIAANADTLAAVLLEPMQGGGGCIAAEPAFLHALRAATERVGALLIFDEVMTSRLSPGGLQQTVGVTPDMTTLGKYFGGGASFGAFGGRRDVMALFDPRDPSGLPHAGTFNNNVLTMAAGLAGLASVFTPEVAVALNARGDALRERLNALFAARGSRLRFRGIGSLMNLHVTDAPLHSTADVPADGRLRDLFFFEMLARGIYMARRGFIALSLEIGDAECDAIVAATAEFLDEHGDLARA